MSDPTSQMERLLALRNDVIHAIMRGLDDNEQTLGQMADAIMPLVAQAQRDADVEIIRPVNDVIAEALRHAPLITEVDQDEWPEWNDAEIEVEANRQRCEDIGCPGGPHQHDCPLIGRTP